MNLTHLVNISVIVLVAGIVWSIVRSVRQVNAQIEGKLRGIDPRKREDVARELAAQVRARVNRVKCPKCGGLAFAMLDRDPWWKCDSCNWEFEGPEHLPLPEGVPESGHPTGG
jgi:ribosomal protein L37AE/L43A